MVFASQAFIAFLVVVIGVYWALGRRHATAGKSWLILASLFFYGYWSPVYLLLLLGSIGGNFLVVQALLRSPDAARRRVLLALGITANLLLIAYYKYFAFLVESWNLFSPVDARVPEILLPIGISFFTFQQIGLLVDTARGTVARLTLTDHVFFNAFFPHLIAGPIVSQAEMLPQLAARTRWLLSDRELATGLALFSLGLFKKTVLIDPFARHVDAIYTVAARGEPLSLIDGWMAGMGYGFQIYFDFSGYSDMAIGLACMFGVAFPLNFFSPYKATSIRQFWRRWHVTLSRFLQKLLYIPFGGNRHGLARTILALVATMGIGGLWHGAGWNFVIWGLLHGVFLSINHVWLQVSAGRWPAWRAFLADSALARAVLHAACVVLTFAAVSFTWVFFRAPDIGTALRLAEAMLGFGAGTGMHWVTEDMWPRLLPYFLIVWALPNSMELFRRSGTIIHIDDYPSGVRASRLAGRFGFRVVPAWSVASAGIFLVAWFMLSNLSPFIYFQF